MLPLTARYLTLTCAREMVMLTARPEYTNFSVATLEVGRCQHS